MKWLTRLRTYLGYDELPDTGGKTGDLEEATRAYESARQALSDAKRRQLETKRIGSLLADLNERNHYGESIMLSMLPKERRT